LTRLLAVSATLLVAASAHATTIIDFNADPNNTYWVPTVTSNGFLATENNSEGGTPLGSNIAVDSRGPSNGTVHLDSWTNDSADSVWTLTQIGGGAFSLQGFDFADGYPGGSDAVSRVTLTGTKADSSTVTQSFAISQVNFQTLLVSSNFNNLKSVKFDAFGVNNRAAYDNIKVDGAAVPEPAALALMGLGLAGLAVMRRRQSK
jgi:hypothetical protein